MKKDEFLSLLEKRLQILNEKERQDILDEYRTHIEMKMQEGKSEEEAIQDFGDIDELIDDILDAYKINTEKMDTTNDRLDKLFDFIFHGCKNIIASLTSMELNDVLRLLFEIIIIFVLLILLKIPFVIISFIGSYLLRILFEYNIGSTLSRIWDILVNAIYIIVFISMLIKMVRNRIAKYKTDEMNEHGFSKQASAILNDYNLTEIFTFKRVLFLLVIIPLLIVLFLILYIINWSAVYNISILLCLMFFSGSILIVMLLFYLFYNWLWKKRA